MKPGLVAALPLGLRMAFAAGRESLARLALAAVGVAVGVTLLLITLTAMPALEGRAARMGWHNTSAGSPATAQDAALWLGVADHYAGENLFRVYVAALGPNPPVPPGLTALPGPGEVVVSPGLQQLLESTPDDQLRDRFPGRISGTIGDGGLAWPGELVAVVGVPENALKAFGAQEVHGIAPPGSFADAPLIRAMLTIVGTGLLLPVIVFVAMVTRVAAARREQRFAALRLAGATRAQTSVMAAAETGLAAVIGTVLGFAGYHAVRPFVAGSVTYEGEHFIAADVTAPTGQLLLVLAGAPVLAMLTTLVGMHRVNVTPLGVGRRVRRKPPGPGRLVPLGLGVAGFIALGTLVSTDAIDGSEDEARVLTQLSLVFTLAGLVIAGPWVCGLASRALARLARKPTTLMAARRIAADPFTTFRAISGVVLAVFVTTVFSCFINATIGDRNVSSPVNMRAGVVEIEAAGKPLDPNVFVAESVVVARLRPDGVVAMACSDLVTVSQGPCRAGLRGPRSLWYVKGLAEPTAADAALPIQTVFVRTDGSTAAEERVRTLAARTAPGATVNTQRDFVELEGRQLSEVDTALRLATAFVLLVAACSLTVAVIAGLIERRRPLALLRASGVRVSELRRMVMLETAVPLGLTVAASVGLGLVASYALGAGSASGWAPPGWDFALSMGLGVLVAFAITTVVLPLMDVATRHNSVRFE